MSKPELKLIKGLLLIASMSCPAIANIFGGGSVFLCS